MSLLTASALVVLTILHLHAACLADNEAKPLQHHLSLHRRSESSKNADSSRLSPSSNLADKSYRAKRQSSDLQLQELGGKHFQLPSDPNGPVIDEDTLMLYLNRFGNQDGSEELDENETDENDAGLINKRPRQFVGKRESDHEEEKRLRDFVGKRNSFYEPQIWGPFDKRLRDFVGKRSVGEFNMEKRLRAFVGKRDGSEDIFMDEEKRPRQFVGKRLRNFVGKREYDLDDLAMSKRLRDFVGKRARQFVGKRSDLDSVDLEKRLRDFVGKRMFSLDKDFQDSDEKIEKRPRQFVGKRDEMEIAKRPRQFVGKRLSDKDFEVDKRLRDFVGK